MKIRIHVNDLALIELKYHRDHIREMIRDYGQDYENIDLDDFKTDQEMFDFMGKKSEDRRLMVYFQVNRYLNLIHKSAEPSTWGEFEEDGLWIKVDEDKLDAIINRIAIGLKNRDKIRKWLDIKGWIFSRGIRLKFKEIYNEESISKKVLWSDEGLFNGMYELADLISNEIDDETLINFCKNKETSE